MKRGGEHQKQRRGTEQAELKVMLHGWGVSCKKPAQPLTAEEPWL